MFTTYILNRLTILLGHNTNHIYKSQVLTLKIFFYITIYTFGKIKSSRGCSR